MNGCIIGVDYGVAKNDIPMYTVAKKVDEGIMVIDSGRLSDFDYNKYVASEYQIIGEKEDLELFRKQFSNNK